MCGLVAWAGSSPEKFNYTKIHTLGVLNETRGKHSCGISFDKEIWAGVKEEKLWRDFSPKVKNLLDDLPLQNPVVIGHTRWATGGAHNKENAHPFGFGDDGNGSFQLCGAHNGSLIQYEELAKKYNVDVWEGEGKDRRKKIDSEILLEILFLEGYEVLKDYLGAAALIWYEEDSPNVLYCYHGESKLYNTSNTVTEERPLFYLKDDEGSLYVSSIKESLHVINDNGGEVGEFKHNQVYKITNGDVDNAEIFEVDRKGRFQKELGNSYSGGYSHSHNYSFHANKKKEEKKEEEGKKENNTSSSVKTPVIYDLHKEKIVVKFNEAFKSQIYYNRLRYWQGEKVITGVYAPMKHNPMCYLGPTGDLARENYSKFHDANKFTEEPLLFFYYKGVALKTELDYKVAVEKELKAESLSFLSKYPIIDLTDVKSKIIMDNKPVDEFILPYLSTKVYTFSEGKCIDLIVPGEKLKDYKHAMLQEDQKVLELIDPRFKKRDTKEEDRKKVLDVKEEIESTLDDCVVEINDNVEDEEVKREGIGLLELIRDKIKDTFKEIWK